MNEQSDTPRTDAIVNSHVKDGPYVTEHHDLLADFARTLERELNEAKALDKITVNSYSEKLAEVLIERDQLRADLKMCAEAMNEFYCTSNEVPVGCKAYADAYEKLGRSISRPSIQSLLKGK